MERNEVELQQHFFPVGIQTFSELRTKNYLYVDKTEYVYRMTHSASKYIFLSRPRRFGKSLLTSALRAYFEGRKELFEGLAIDRLETEWTTYPVLHFDMSTAKHVDKEHLEQELSFKLLEYENIYGRGAGEINTNQRLQGLIMRANKQTGKQVVVLIDEYDAPLLDVIHEEKNLPVLRNVMRNFYSPLKACDPYLHFVFLTGITKFSQLSIFSELNNITNISMDQAYAAICGITEEEMLTQMSDDLNILAEKMGMTRSEALAKLKTNYDGYHFTWPSPDMYNPFSLMNAFNSSKLNSYWFGSGTPTYLVEMLNKYGVEPQQIGGRKVLAEERMDDALRLLQTFLSTIPQCDNTNYEGHYQSLLYTIFSLLGRYVDVEVRTPRGRVDMVMRTPTTLYVVELKLDKSANAAMSQIDLKNYPERFALCGLPVVKVVINFDGERHTIEDWQINKKEDANA